MHHKNKVIVIAVCLKARSILWYIIDRSIHIFIPTTCDEKFNNISNILAWNVLGNGNSHLFKL